MQLKNYQNTAIKKLLTGSKELLEQSGEKKIIFKANRPFIFGIVNKK